MGTPPTSTNWELLRQRPIPVGYREGLPRGRATPGSSPSVSAPRDSTRGVDSRSPVAPSGGPLARPALVSDAGSALGGPCGHHKSRSDASAFVVLAVAAMVLVFGQLSIIIRIYYPTMYCLVYGIFYMRATACYMLYKLYCIRSTIYALL